MGIIGEELRAAREKKEVSLNEAEEVTKIRVRYLEALEDEEFDVIPGKVYIKGFLKNYAEFLDLDSQRILNTYNEIHIGNSEEIEEDNYPITPTLQTIRSSNNKYIFLMTALFCIIVFGVITNLLYGTIKSPGKADNYSKSTIPKTAAADTNKKNTDNQVSLDNKEKVNNSITNKVNLVITATKKDSWALIKVDGKQKFLGVIKRNQEFSFAGQKKIYVHLGNSGAVDIVYNGNKIKPIGPINRVGRKTFTENGMQ